MCRKNFFSILFSCASLASNKFFNKCNRRMSKLIIYSFLNKGKKFLKLYMINLIIVQMLYGLKWIFNSFIMLLQIHSNIYLDQLNLMFSKILTILLLNLRIIPIIHLSNHIQHLVKFCKLLNYGWTMPIIFWYGTSSYQGSW